MDAGSIKRFSFLMICFWCLVDDASSQNQCYSCDYVRSGDIITGPEACYESFNPSADGINTVNCSGECEYSIQEFEGTLQVTRGCSFFSDCTESSSTSGTSASSNFCCSGTLCNDDTITDKAAEPLADDECYECDYVTSAFGTVGSPGCYEPFDASAVGITKTQCSSSCQLTVIKVGTDLTVTRGCQDPDFECPSESCVTSGDDSVCEYCCSPGTVCSKGALLFVTTSLLLLTTFVCFTFFM